MTRGILIMTLLACHPAWGESLLAARTIRSQSVIMPGDLRLVSGEVPGALGDPEAALGMEARIMIYAGQPVRAQDIGPPALIERNQVVALVFARGGLSIVTEGRALDRAAAGERVRVMNLASKTTVTGLVSGNGQVLVGFSEGLQ